jgi:3',5'-nucleoside bisphosphate phosphatase
MALRKWFESMPLVTIARVPLFLFLAWSLAAQVRNPLPVPPVPGYVTLKAEFHIHTVFSDGAVWPTVRVQEAWRDGLDVLAISDHLEYQRYPQYVKVEPGRSYLLAKDLAEELGILLVPAVEITKRYPTHPAHFNALFVTDAAAVKADDLQESLRRARAQGAFIFWNHPGWSVDKAEWFPPMAKAYDEKLFDGIEIGNQNHFYEEAYPWVAEKNLAPLTTGDWHDPVEPMEVAGVRPITLLFARTRDLAGVKEALFAKRTAAWMSGQVWGAEEYLRGLWNSAIRIENPEISTRNANGELLFRVRNSSAFTFRYKPSKRPAWLRVEDSEIRPGTLSLWKPALMAAPEGTHNVEVELEVTNFHIAPGRNLIVRVPLKITSTK